ncbi:unnamed protein product, partial [Candidula unifasciata]
VLTVDEVEQSVFSVGYIEMFWSDPDLIWDQAEYGGVDTISVRYDEIWHPSIRIANTADPDYMMIDKAQLVSLSSTGSLRYVTPVYLKTTCNMDLTYYPFDTQVCDIFFFPVFDDVRQNISARVAEELDSGVSVTGQWKVKSRTMTRMAVGDIADVEVFVMVIERRPVFYLLCVLAPMILTSSVTSIVFWIPPKSGEKMSFLVTVFVSDALFLNFVAELMPRSLMNVPRLPLFLVLVTLQCMFAILATIFVMRKYEQEQNSLLFKKEQDKKNDKILYQRKEVHGDLEPTMTAGEHSKITASYFAYIFDKFSSPTSRVAPFDKVGRTEKIPKTQRKCQTFSLRSSTWDMIFFWLFLAITIPVYYIIFKA